MDGWTDIRTDRGTNEWASELVGSWVGDPLPSLTTANGSITSALSQPKFSTISQPIDIKPDDSVESPCRSSPLETLAEGVLVLSMIHRIKYEEEGEPWIRDKEADRLGNRRPKSRWVNDLQSGGNEFKPISGR